MWGRKAENPAKVLIANQMLEVTALPRTSQSEGRSLADRIAVGDLGLLVTVIHDQRTGTDRAFQVYETGSGMMSKIVSEGIQQAKNSGLPVIMDLQGKAMVVDHSDTPEGVMASFSGLAQSDIQAGLDNYNDRVTARERALGSLAVADAPGDKAARAAGEKRDGGQQQI